MGINFYKGVITINSGFRVYSMPSQSLPLGPTIYLSLTSGIDLTINNSYPTNSTLIINNGITASSYLSAINFNGLQNATVNLTGITLDGVNGTHLYNIMTFYSCSNVTVYSGSTKQCGYRQMVFDTRNVNVQIVSHSFLDNAEPARLYNPLAWDGTDSSVSILNCGFSGCYFSSSAIADIGNYVDNTQNPPISGMVKNFTVDQCYIYGGNIGTALRTQPGWNTVVSNNFISGTNQTLTSDERIFWSIGTMQFINNTAKAYGDGHIACVWSVSYGTSSIQTSSFNDNYMSHSIIYSAFEFQEFANRLVTGSVQTTYADLYMNRNTAVYLNTSNNNWGPAIIDIYPNVIGGHTYMYYNTGSNWINTNSGPYPPANTYWNPQLVAPTSHSNNIYI